MAETEEKVCCYAVLGVQVRLPRRQDFFKGVGGGGECTFCEGLQWGGGGGRSASFAEVSSGSTLSFNGTVWSRLGRGNGLFACDALLICNELHEGSIQIGSEKNMPEGDDQIGNEEDV